MPIRNKTIIAIWNTASQGKTKSIQNAAALFDQRPNTSIIAGHVPANGEVSVTMLMDTSLGQVVVSFESQGDPNTSLENRLQSLVTGHVDIVVCAKRTSGGTVRAVGPTWLSSSMNVNSDFWHRVAGASESDNQQSHCDAD